MTIVQPMSIPEKWSRWSFDILSANVLTLGVTALRLLFPEDLNKRAPFLFYLSTVVISTLLRGTLCGLTTMLGAGLASWYFFLSDEKAIPSHILLMGARMIEWFWVIWVCARARRTFLLQQRVLQSRNQLFALASHELRNPLQAISAGLFLFKQDHAPMTELMTRGLNIVDRQVKRMIVLVDDLLDAARIHAGKLHLNRERLDLCSVVQDVVERFNSPQIQFYYCTEIWGLWDRLRVDQIVTNLLSNAMKYGRGNPIRVEVLLNHHHARIVVQDRGIGMDRFQLERAFIPFDRLGAEKSPHQGYGLGLWIVHEIVQSKGGQITLFSEPSVGTTVAVELPLVPPEHHQPQRFLKKLVEPLTLNTSTGQKNEP
jgi:signal transduction histidine kinase